MAEKPKKPTKRKVPQNKRDLIGRFDSLSDDEVLTMHSTLGEYIAANFDFEDVSDDDLHEEETDGGTQNASSGFAKFFGG